MNNNICKRKTVELGFTAIPFCQFYCAKQGVFEFLISMPKRVNVSHIKLNCSGPYAIVFGGLTCKEVLRVLVGNIEKNTG